MHKRCYAAALLLYVLVQEENSSIPFDSGWGKLINGFRPAVRAPPRPQAGSIPAAARSHLTLQILIESGGTSAAEPASLFANKAHTHTHTHTHTIGLMMGAHQAKRIFLHECFYNMATGQS